MTRIHSPRWVVLTCAGLVLLAGCDSPAGTEDVEQDEIRAKLISRLEALPGAEISARITSGLDTGQNNVGVQVRGPAAATDTELESVAGRAERTIWLSRLDPLGRISINVTRQGSPDPVLQRLYQSRLDTGPLRKEYGPRPDGLSG